MLPDPLRVAITDLAYAIELCASTSQIDKLGMAASCAEKAANRIRWFATSDNIQTQENLIMAADFRALLQKPMDEIKRPPAWPAGTYHGTITAHKLDESKQKKTPYVDYTIKITNAGEDVDQAGLEGIVLPDREWHKAFYFTDNSLYRVKEFLESVGVPTEGRALGECLPEALNARVLVAITQRNSEDGKELYNEVGEVKGEE